MVPLSKSGVRKHRGFESHPLRQVGLMDGIRALPAPASHPARSLVGLRSSPMSASGHAFRRSPGRLRQRSHLAERSPSGLWRRTGNAVRGNPSRVRNPSLSATRLAGILARRLPIRSRPTRVRGIQRSARFRASGRRMPDHAHAGMTPSANAHQPASASIPRMDDDLAPTPRLGGRQVPAYHACVIAYHDGIRGPAQPGSGDDADAGARSTSSRCLRASSRSAGRRGVRGPDRARRRLRDPARRAASSCSIPDSRRRSRISTRSTCGTTSGRASVPEVARERRAWTSTRSRRSRTATSTSTTRARTPCSPTSRSTSSGAEWDVANEPDYTSGRPSTFPARATSSAPATTRSRRASGSSRRRAIRPAISRSSSTRRTVRLLLVGQAVYSHGEWSGIADAREGATSAPDGTAYARSVARLKALQPEAGPVRPRPRGWPTEHRSGAGRAPRPAGVSLAGRARRGTSGALYLQSAPAGLNSSSRPLRSEAAAPGGVEDRVPRSGESRTVSGPEGSSTQRSSSGAAERPDLSRLQRWARVPVGRPEVHGN